MTINVIRTGRELKARVTCRVCEAEFEFGPRDANFVPNRGGRSRGIYVTGCPTCNNECSVLAEEMK